MKLAEKIGPLLHNSDPRQLRRFANILRFFAALLVVTLVARGTAGVTMPVVEIQSPASGTVSTSISASATVACAGGEPFTLPEGLLVTGVPVQVGQEVQAGDTLATFDSAELARAIASKKAELQQVQVQAAQQQKGDEADPYNAQLSQQQLERAYEDTQKTYEDGQESIERAREKRDEAARAVEDARNAPLDSALPQQDAEAQKQAKIEAATAALEAAEETLYQTEKAAESANEAALSAAQNAEDSRNTALHALEKEEENVAEQNELNRAAAAVSNANAAYLQAELDQLLALQTSGGQYLAPKAGTIVELDLIVGQPSPAVGGLLADADADYTVEIPLTKQQAELVVVGTVLHVSQAGSGGDAAVQSLSSPDADGNVMAKATLPQGNWSAGAASATATAQTARQDLVLPATAVRQDNGGSYVLAVEEQNTLLGLQNVLVSLPVTVEETGDTMVAVSGALDYRTQVVVTSNKAIQAGDTVRIKQ